MRMAENALEHAVRTEPGYLTLEEGGAYVGLSERTMRRFVDSRAIPSFRVPCSPGSTRLQTRLRRRDLDEFMERFRVPSFTERIADN
jgi:excisionase family DNA binding protein